MLLKQNSQYVRKLHVYVTIYSLILQGSSAHINQINALVLKAILKQ